MIKIMLDFRNGTSKGKEQIVSWKHIPRIGEKIFNEGGFQYIVSDVLYNMDSKLKWDVRLILQSKPQI